MLLSMTTSKFPTAPDMTSPQANDVAGENDLPAVEPLRARPRRIWALALGTAALWQLDPAFVEMADMVAMIACAGNKSLAKDAITKMRSQADQLRASIAPLSASALAKVVRRAEAACGAVLDKGVRVREVKNSWDMFEACVRAPRDHKA